VAPKKGKRPTNKWIAARVTAIAGIAIMAVTTDGWDDEETVAAITLVSEALVSYLVPNADTPGGVPDAT
jgi:hypothetical protein